MNTQPDFVPEWAKRAVWYQIFPERFCNGNTTNDPTLESLRNSYPHDLSEPWQVHPWTSDWYVQQPYERAHGKDIWFHLQRRRYGGDLQGVIDRLDYLQDLGITAIYLNPVFDAPSSHKYDGANYHHIDPNFGPNPEGDRRIIAAEQPDAYGAWTWTSADLLALELIAEVHRRGMRIIFDGVFNHMGLNSWAFQDIVQHGQASRFADWFKVSDWDRPSRFAPFTYRGWFGVHELPELRQDANGIVQGPKEYIFACTRRWMDPYGNGAVQHGIDGWRLDVAFCIKHGFWKDWRQHVKAINPDAYLVAEIVVEDDNEPYLQGDEFDAVMNYLWTFACAEFFVETSAAIPPSEFDRRLRELREAYPGCVAYGMQNLLTSHDTARIASHIVNRNQLHYRDWRGYGDLTRPRHNAAFDTRPPTAAERALQKLMVLFQMTYVGAPMIYYGDESGMWGANDPCDRKPMVWPDMDYAAEATLPDGSVRHEAHPVAFDYDLHGWHRRLIAIRNRSLALQLGAFRTLLVDDNSGIYIFERSYEGEQVVVALNNSTVVQRVTLDIEGTWVNLLDGEATVETKSGVLAVILQPLEGAIFERYNARSTVGGK
ncbi:MAG: alpha-glucosidase C-terminal domain-containing protein [Anaerolineae bacterium]|nr:alpha-glucosidase C-terminal domain-containing protein [Anaerolineae bacterium]